MRKNKKYSFYEKPHAFGGRFSAVIAGISLLLFVLCVILSFAQRGNAGVYVGGIGLIGLMLAVYGFLTGVRSFRETDTTPTLSIVGTIASGVIMLGWITVFLSGL